MKYFWENIAPEWWKLYRKVTKNLRKLNEEKTPEKCKAPFHFLLRTINLSGQRPTICACSLVQPSISLYKFLDVATSLNQNRENCNSPEDIKSILLSKKRKFHETRDALIRGAHDKSKRFRVH